MAEYYPLLAKAVAGIPNSTPEMRRAVYERARKALLAQLTHLDPPIPESDIARETASLDEAVERLETEMAALNGHAAAPAPVPKNEPAPKPAGRAGGAPAPRPMRPLAPGAPASPNVSAALDGKPSVGAKSSEPKSSEFRSSDVPFSGTVPAESEASATASQIPPLASRPTARRSPSGPDAAQENAAIRIPEPRRGTDSGSQAVGNAAGHGGGEHVFGSFEEMVAADAQRPRADGPRLYAPQPGAAEEARTSFRLWIVGGVVALVVAIVAVAAWSLRDRPDAIARLKPSAVAKTETGAKIVTRIGGPKPAETSSSTALAPAPSAPPSTSANPPAPAAKPHDAAQTVAVTHRAALLVASPDAANKVKTYVGTVVWRLDNVSAGPGQPLGTAVHADIDVPDDKMKVALTLQKNTDPSLDVSHTVTVIFTVQPDSPTGGIKQISAPQLRAEDTPNGEPLAGVPVPIMENSFLIGLNRGDAEKSNLELIKQRAWFDIPILLNNGRIAKLTFEKGVSGTRAIDDAIAAWKTQ